jgi:uncharacterized protein involved in exopolysaccharide biosynthesis
LAAVAEHIEGVRAPVILVVILVAFLLGLLVGCVLGALATCEDDHRRGGYLR